MCESPKSLIGHTGNLTIPFNDVVNEKNVTANSLELNGTELQIELSTLGSPQMASPTVIYAVLENPSNIASNIANFVKKFPKPAEEFYRYVRHLLLFQFWRLSNHAMKNFITDFDQ